MIKKAPLKGTRDILPQEANLRRYIQQVIVDTFTKNGFSEIATPSIEQIELLKNNQGGDNEKIMFQILKRGEKLNLDSNKLEDLVDLGLRFDLTLPLSRFYANNLNELPAPFKCFQIGNVWRGERPQKGRYRQFTQCDVDILGDASINAEISLIKTVGDAISNLGFKDHKIRVNDRRLIDYLITKHNLSDVNTDIMIGLDKLDKVSVDKVLAEFESKGIDQDSVKELLSEVENLKNVSVDDLKSNFNCQEVDDLITIIKSFASSDKYKVVYDPNLIRGMGYYTGVVFEVASTSEDLNLSIAGGGRYDKLVGNIINMDIPACGFSIGYERIAMLLENKVLDEECADKYAILCDSLSDGDYRTIMHEIDKLQAKGYVVSFVSKKKNLTKQIDDLKISGYNKVCIYKDKVEFKEV